MGREFLRTSGKRAPEKPRRPAKIAGGAASCVWSWGGAGAGCLPAGGLAGRAFLDRGGRHGAGDGVAQARLMEVMSADQAGPRVRGELRRREHVLPDPLRARVRVLSLQRRPQVDAREAGSSVGVEELPDLAQVRLERSSDRVRKHGHPVLVPFAVANEDLAVGEVHVFHPKPEAVREAKPAPVEELPHDPVSPLQLGEYPVDLVGSEHAGQMGGGSFAFPNSPIISRNCPTAS